MQQIWAKSYRFQKCSQVTNSCITIRATNDAEINIKLRYTNIIEIIKLLLLLLSRKCRSLKRCACCYANTDGHMTLHLKFHRISNCAQIFDPYSLTTCKDLYWRRCTRMAQHNAASSENVNQSADKSIHTFAPVILPRAAPHLAHNLNAITLALDRLTRTLGKYRTFKVRFYPFLEPIFFLRKNFYSWCFLYKTV